MSGFDLEAEVRDVAARRDIYKVLCNCMCGQDRQMQEGQRSAFHDDACDDCGLYAGNADGSVDFAQGFLGKVKCSQHLIEQAHITVECKVAHGEIYFVAWHRIEENGGEKDLCVAGRYIDRCEDRGTGWKIAKRHELIDWVRTGPAADSFLREQSLLQRMMGARGTSDFSNQRNWP